MYGSRYLTELGHEAGSWSERTWSGNDRPKGMSKKDPAYNAPHYYTSTLTRKVIPRVSVSVDVNYPWEPRKWVVQPPGNTVGSLYGLPNFPPDPWDANATLELVSKLRTKVNDGSANIGVTIAEMGETLDTIASISRRVAKLTFDTIRDLDDKIPSKRRLAYLAKKYGRKALRKGVFKKSASQYLEYRYAVMPALYDLDAHCETLANLNNKKAVTRKQTGKILTDRRPPGKSAPASFGEATTTHRAYVRAFLSEEPNRLLSYTGVADPAAILYEKFPLSFVLDWFVPVNNFLAAVDFWRRNSGTFVVTHVLEQTCSGFWYIYPENGQYNQVWEPDPGFSYRKLWMERTVNTELQIPYPNLDRRIGKSMTSLKHALDAVSLFVVPGLKGRY